MTDLPMTNLPMTNLEDLITYMFDAGIDSRVAARLAAEFAALQAQVRRAPMSNAERQARWRERKKAAEPVTEKVTEETNITNFVTPVIGVSSPSSSLSPTPPILTTSLPSKTPEGEISLGKTIDAPPEANPKPPGKPEAEIVSAAERRFNRRVYPDLPDDWAGFAAERGLSRVEAEELFELFANHWTAKAGRGGRKRDWSLLWHNWVIDAMQRRAWRRKHYGRSAAGAAPEPVSLSHDARKSAVRRYLETLTWNRSWGKLPSQAEISEAQAVMAQMAMTMAKAG